ncbi:MAG: UMP kinase [Patescibacteria group bacterium]|jgi:uridylate kinase
MNKTFVLSVGGSLIVTKEGIDIKFLKSFRAFILGQIKKGYKFYLVVGGGVTARTYIKAALQTTKINSASRDWVGISATRLNAQLVKVILGQIAHSETIIDPTKKIKTVNKVVIAAGFKPGWSTDYCAVLIAKNNGAKTVVNLSNIDYAYNKDPRKFKEAKKLIKATWPEFQKVVGTKWQPGLNVPFDPVASQEAAKNKMKVVILNGQNLKNLERCLDGREFKGTTIGF